MICDYRYHGTESYGYEYGFASCPKCHQPREHPGRPDDPWEEDSLSHQRNDLDFEVKCAHCFEPVEYDGEAGHHETAEAAERCWRQRFKDEAVQWDAADGKLRHGRHCMCTPCAATDWSDPTLGPCDYHWTRHPYEPVQQVFG